VSINAVGLAGVGADPPHSVQVGIGQGVCCGQQMRESGSYRDAR
jgi:hypothetical protein